MNPALRRSSAHVFVEALTAPSLDERDRHHLLRVLRLRAGEAVTVSDGAGAWRVCRLGPEGTLTPDGDIVVGHSRGDSPSVSLTVGVAIPKAERPEWIVQKLTEIGVDHIVFVAAARSVVRWDAAKAARNLERLVAREAAMQSRRLTIPVVDGPLALSELLAASSASAALALAEPGEADLDPSINGVLIGPEGGWSPAELDLVERRVGLGPTVLRVETAALVAATRLVQLHRGAGHAE
ncbi:MAG TPA: RsmE family RNA methyltransferase [Ilumatobacteraceae bacterium]|nr:RsmE family RNA methyltransferase [Ilumatobacteraceae bacterium]